MSPDQPHHEYVRVESLLWLEADPVCRVALIRLFGKFDELVRTCIPSAQRDEAKEALIAHCRSRWVRRIRPWPYAGPLERDRAVRRSDQGGHTRLLGHRLAAVITPDATVSEPARSSRFVT